MQTETWLDYGISITRAFFKFYYYIYIVLLVFVLVTLSVIGGLVFQIVESPPEAKIIDSIVRQRDSTLKQLFTKVTNSETKSEITLAVQLYEVNYISAIRNGTVLVDGQPDPLWTFAGAVYYCVTTFSLVGYGNLAPRTSLGRAIAIIYCGFTIPVNSLILAELGEMLLLAFEYMWKKVNKIWLKTRPAEKVPNNINVSNMNTCTCNDCQVTLNLSRDTTDTNCHSTDTRCHDTNTNFPQTDTATSCCYRANHNYQVAQQTRNAIRCSPSQKVTELIPGVTSRGDPEDAMGDATRNNSESIATELAKTGLFEVTAYSATTTGENDLWGTQPDDCADISDFEPWTFPADENKVTVHNSSLTDTSAVCGSSLMNDLPFSVAGLCMNDADCFRRCCSSNDLVDAGRDSADSDIDANDSFMIDPHVAICECPVCVPWNFLGVCCQKGSNSRYCDSSISEPNEINTGSAISFLDNDLGTSTIGQSDSAHGVFEVDLCDSAHGVFEVDLCDSAHGVFEVDLCDSTHGVFEVDLCDSAHEADLCDSAHGVFEADLCDSAHDVVEADLCDSANGTPENDPKDVSLSAPEYDLDDCINGALGQNCNSDWNKKNNFLDRNNVLLLRSWGRSSSWLTIDSTRCSHKSDIRLYKSDWFVSSVQQELQPVIKKPAKCQLKKPANLMTFGHPSEMSTNWVGVDSAWTVSDCEKSDASDSTMHGREVISVKNSQYNRTVDIFSHDSEYASLKQLPCFIQILVESTCSTTSDSAVASLPVATLNKWNIRVVQQQTHIPIGMVSILDRRTLSDELGRQLSDRTCIEVARLMRASNGNCVSSTRYGLYSKLAGTHRVRPGTVIEHGCRRVPGSLAMSAQSRTIEQMSRRVQRGKALMGLSRVYGHSHHHYEERHPLAKFQIGKYKADKHSFLATSSEHFLSQRHILVWPMPYCGITFRLCYSVRPNMMFQKKKFSNDKTIGTNYYQKSTTVPQISTDRKPMTRYADISKKQSTISRLNGRLVYVDTECASTMTPCHAQSTEAGACLMGQFTEPHSTEAGACLMGQFTEPQSTDAGACLMGQFTEPHSTEAGACLMGQFTEPQSEECRNVSRRKTCLVKPEQIQQKCSTAKSNYSQLLQLSASICTQIKQAIGEKKSTVKLNCFQRVFSQVKAAATLILEKEVKMPERVGLFWLGTPLRGVYIGTRIGNGIRKYLRNPRVKRQRSNKSFQPKRSRKTSTNKHIRRNRNNNVGFEEDDEDEDGDGDTEDGDLAEIEIQESNITSEPVLLTIATTFMFISLGSTFLTRYAQNMTYFDCYWFIWISVATIGYGDIVPTEQRLFVGILAYIFIGLCLMSNLISETSLFFSANVSKTRAITTDAVAIINTRKQLIEIKRRADKANHHWEILRDRVVYRKIPRRLVEESLKYKAGLMSEEREMVRWAYKIYFKQQRKQELANPPPLQDDQQSIIRTSMDSQPSEVEYEEAAPAAPPPASEPEVKEKEKKLKWFQKLKKAIAKPFHRIKKKPKHMSLLPEPSPVTPSNVEVEQPAPDQLLPGQTEILPLNNDIQPA